MNNFLKKIFFFLVPILIIVLFLVCLDFFKVFKNYSSYTESTAVTLNREFVCLKTFEKNISNQKYDSFIFGSSRSQAFKCKDWSKYLPDNRSPFHFDANNESLLGVYNKMKFLSKNCELKEVLFILDNELLDHKKQLSRSENHLTVAHPDVSENNWYEFYLPFIKSSLNPKFIISYTDYSIFNTYRSYMKGFVNESTSLMVVDSISCDIFYASEKFIEKDSVLYYKNLMKKNIFKYRKADSLVSVLDSNSIELLNKIALICEENRIKIKIIISPMFSQQVFPKNDLVLLREIFGIKSIFDFSGKNEFTSNLGNYYEQSHYRPHVARSIMNQIYE